MVRESRHLWVGNLPENVNKDRVEQYFTRYGPVQSVRVLPKREERDGTFSGTLQVSFMDITFALKARQSEHRFEDRILETDFYSPDSSQSGATSSSSAGPGSEDKSSTLVGSSSSSSFKVDQRSSHSYARGAGPPDKFRAGGRYHDDYRNNRPRHPYRNSSFNQDTRNGINSGAYTRNTYTNWRDRVTSTRPDQYSSSADKLDNRSNKPVNGISSSSLEHGSSSHHLSSNLPQSHGGGGGGGGGGPHPHLGGGPLSGGGGSHPPRRTTKKKCHKSRSSDSCSNSSESRSGGSRSSSSSSSRSSSSGSNSSKSRSPASRGSGGGGCVLGKIQSSLGNYLPHTEFDKQCTIILANLPHRAEDGKLRDELNREYKKSGCSVRAIRIKSLPNSHRVAIVTFSDPVDVAKALEDSRNKRIFGSLIEAKKLHSSNDERPRDSELNEFHPKATRTLHVGNISREVNGAQLHDRFKEFGEILEIDIKKPDYALVQFVDIKSVINAIRNVDGELIAGQRVRLAFGPSVATKCVWCDGVGEEVTVKMLTHEFAQHGKIQDLIIDRSRGHALVYFDQLKKATIAVMELRGRSIGGSRLQTDYASHECRAAFFDHCKKTGMDVRERAKPWEQDQSSSERRDGDRLDRLGRERSIDSRSSPIPPRSGSRRDDKHPSSGGRKGRDEYDEELRKFQSVRDKFDDSERCFTPPSHRRPPLPVSRSPTPTSSRLGRSPGAHSRSSAGYDVRNESRTFSDRDSVVSDSSRPESPSSRDPFRGGRYVPRTQAISPPASESRHSSPAHVVDDYDRQRRYRLRDVSDSSCDYRRAHTNSGDRSSTKDRPTDPRVIEDTDKKNVGFKCAGVDSGLSEDTSSGSSGSVPDVDNAKLPSSRVSAPHRRISTDSAVSRSSAQGTDSRPSSPPMIPVYTAGSGGSSSLLRVVAAPQQQQPEGGGAPRTPSSPPPDSDGSRPGTPLCDENPENLVCRPTSGPVRLSSHVRTNSTSEPMSLPLPMFAQDVASTSPGDRRPSTDRGLRPNQISPRDTTSLVLKSSGSAGSTNSGGSKPDLSVGGTSIVSPTKLGAARDPRLKSPSIKSPGVSTHSPLGGGVVQKSRGSGDLLVPPQVVPAAVAKSIRSPHNSGSSTTSATNNTDQEMGSLLDPGSLLLNVNTHSESRQRPVGNMTGLLAVAVPNQAPTSTSMSPGGVLGTNKPQDHQDNAKSNQNLDERIKTLKLQYEKWNDRVAGSGRSDASSRFNLDLKPNQPSAIVQKLLSRKSVFDDDTKRLENQNDIVRDDKGDNSPFTATTGGLKPGMLPGGQTPSDPSATPTNNNFNSPLLATVNHMTSPYSRDIHAPVSTVISTTSVTPTSSRISLTSKPSPSSHRSPGGAVTPTSMSPRGLGSNRLMQGYFTSQQPVSSVTSVKPDETVSVSRSGEDDKQQSSRPLPLPHKAGAAATTATVPIKPLVDKLSKSAAFTKPSATVTPTLKSSSMTSVRSSVSSSLPSTKTVSTCTVVPSTNQQQPLTQMSVVPAVEKGEASSTTCSPKLDTSQSKMEISPVVEETDSDPNVTSTTKDLGVVDKKKHHDLVSSKDPIKIVRKEIDSLSYKDKKELKEELFAPTLLQSTPKLMKKLDSAEMISRDNKQRSKDTPHSKDKLKVKDKHKHKIKHNNDLKDFLFAPATIRKEPVKKEEKKEDTSRRKEEDHNKEKKRRLSSNSEVEETEPKSKHVKLSSSSTKETEHHDAEARKQKLSAMGRIPKIEKTEPKKEERKDKHKHSQSSSSFSSSSSSKSSKDKSKSEDKPDKHRHKDKKDEKERSRSKHEEDKNKKSSSSSSSSKSKLPSVSTDDLDRSRKEKEKEKDKEAKKHKDKKDLKKEEKKDKRDHDKDRKDKEHKSKDSKDKVHRDKEKEKLKEKEKEREKERKERKRKKEEEKKKAEQQTKKAKKKLEDSSEEDDSSDEGSSRKFSIFDEPADLDNPTYFSMYDKVKARRSCVKAREEEEARKQQEALDKFSKLKAERLKREEKKAVESSDELMSDGGKKSFSSGCESDAKLKKKKTSLLVSSSENEHDTSTTPNNNMQERRRKKKVSSGSERKSSGKMFVNSSDDSDTEHFESVKTKASNGMMRSKPGPAIFSSDDELTSSVVSTHKKPKVNIYTDSESNTESKPVYIKKEPVEHEKKKKAGGSESESEPGDNKSSALAVLTKVKKKSPVKDLDGKKSSIKLEPTSSDSEIDLKPVKAELDVEIKTEPTSISISSISSISEEDKKPIKKERKKERDVEKKALLNTKIFATSSEDESFTKNSKPPTPNTGSLKTSSISKPMLSKLKVDQVFSASDGDKDNLDSPALMSESDDDDQVRPPTPTFTTSKSRHDDLPPAPVVLTKEEASTGGASLTKPKLSLFDSSDEEATTTTTTTTSTPVDTKKEMERKMSMSAHERMKQSENLFDKLLTVNVDESVRLPKKSPVGSAAKSPGSSAKSPGQRLTESQKSPGSHKSPLISPGGKPTYLLAHAFNSRASKEAEKRHKEQELELIKYKSEKKDKVEVEVEVKEDEEEDDIKIVEERKVVSDDSSNDVEIVSAEESVKKDDDVSMKSLSENEEKTSKDVKTDDKPEITTIDDTSSSKADTDSKKDSDADMKSSVESDDEEGKLVIGEADENSDSEVVVNMEETKSSPSNSTNSEEPEVIMEHINKEPDLTEVKPDIKLSEETSPEVSITSDTIETKSNKRLSTDEANHSHSSEIEAPARKPVISQEEEIENAVKGLLGESFDTFEPDDKADVSEEMETMEVQETTDTVDDEAAAAVAGLGISMSPEDQSTDWIQTQEDEKVEKETSVKPAVEPEQPPPAVVDKEPVKPEEKEKTKEVEVVDEPPPAEKPAPVTPIPEPSITTRGRRGRSSSARGGAKVQTVKAAEKMEIEEQPPLAQTKTEPAPTATPEPARGKTRGRIGLGFGIGRGIPRQEPVAATENKDIDVFEFQDEDDTKSTESPMSKLRETEDKVVVPPPPAAEPVRPVMKGRGKAVAKPSVEPTPPVVSTPDTAVTVATTSAPLPSKDVITVSSTTVALPTKMLTTTSTAPSSTPETPKVKAIVEEKVSPTVAVTKSPETIKPSRLRRSTGGKSRESEEEPADSEQDQKFKLIIEQAKQEAEQAAQQLVAPVASVTGVPSVVAAVPPTMQGALPITGLPSPALVTSLVSQAIPIASTVVASPALIVATPALVSPALASPALASPALASPAALAGAVLPAPALVSPSIANTVLPSPSLVSTTLAASSLASPVSSHLAPGTLIQVSNAQIQLKAGVPQPTVLPPRHDQQVRPPRNVTPIRPVNTVAPALRAALPIQFPTQPLPPESVRKTQPVLLEQNQPPVPKNSQPVVIPRSTIAISLPTEPIPRSVAMPGSTTIRMPTAGGLPVTAAKVTLPSSLTRVSQAPGVAPAQRLPLAVAVSSVARLGLSNVTDVPHRMTTAPATKPSSPITPVTPKATVPLTMVSSQLVTTARPQLTPQPRKPVVAPPPRASPTAEGLRVSLKQRETSESDPDKIREQPVALDLAASAINPLVKKEYLQPRDVELNRPSSTPVQVPPGGESLLSPKDDDKILYQQQMDQQTIEYKIRTLLYNQLIQSGYSVHDALQQLPGLREKYLEEASKHTSIQAQLHAAHAQAQAQAQEEERRQPLPAHSGVHFRPAADSSFFHVPAPAHSNSQLPYHVRDHVIHPPPAHPEMYRPPPPGGDELVPPVAHSSQIKRLAHSAGVADFSIRTATTPKQQLPAEGDKTNSVDLINSYRIPHLLYPICWTGILGLKNDMANVQMHYVSGCRDLAREYLPQGSGANLKIVQRMRLEDAQIDGVKKKMETKSEHCMLLALPHGNDQDQFEVQSKILRNNFITYLQLKSAAGIANVENSARQPAIVHVFPSCDFANENLARIAPNLLGRVADIDYLVIVIATVYN